MRWLCLHSGLVVCVLWLEECAAVAWFGSRGINLPLLRLHLVAFPLFRHSVSVM